MNMPYCCKNILNLARPLGKNEKSIQEPSKGGMGIKLKIPRRKFIKTIVGKGPGRPSAVTKNESGRGINLIINPKIIPIKKLDAGPARETFSSPHF